MCLCRERALSVLAWCRAPWWGRGGSTWLRGGGWKQDTRVHEADGAACRVRVGMPPGGGELQDEQVGERGLFPARLWSLDFILQARGEGDKIRFHWHERGRAQEGAIAKAR